MDNILEDNIPETKS